MVESDFSAVRVDAAIVGSGQAAPALAAALAARGEQVALFEGHHLGGSCVNVGCTPTKALRKSARVAHMARRAEEFGVRVGVVEVDFAAAMERMAQVVTNSRAGLERWMAGSPNVNVIREWAALDGMNADHFIVRGTQTTVHAARVYLNTGTRPFVPSVPGLAEIPFLTNESILGLRERPAHLLVLGGSYIGLELGQIFRRLGSEVTIIQQGAALASREDPDISARIRSFLEDEGIQVFVDTELVSVQRDAAGAIQVNLRNKVTAENRTIHGSHLLVATGRSPNTEKLALSTVGVTIDKRGFIPVDGALRTNVPGIFALGDINGRGAFTHTSYQDYEITLDHHLGGTRSVNDRVTTYAMFTDPPLGRIGLNDTDARKLAADGRKFLIATHEMKNVSRAKEEGETTGVIKVLVDAETERFVGATLLGIQADEVVQVIGVLMEAKARYRTLKEALPVHPTVTEFFPTILGKLRPFT